jgi:hypothetical protein
MVYRFILKTVFVPPQPTRKAAAKKARQPTIYTSGSGGGAVIVAEGLEESLDIE